MKYMDCIWKSSWKSHAR